LKSKNFTIIIIIDKKSRICVCSNEEGEEGEEEEEERERME